MAESQGSQFGFYSRMFTELSNALNTYVNNTASNIIGAITPVATTLVTIYVMLWGWSMMRGVIQEPITDGIGRIIRLAVITGVALQIGYYNGFLSDMLWNSPDSLASYVGGGSGTSNAAYLDTLMSKMYDFGDAFNKKAQAQTTYGIPNISLLLIAYAIWVAGVAATAYGAFLLAMAKMGLAVVLGVGPLFILMTIFEPTKRFFDAWLGQALNYVFLVMLSAATIKLIMDILMHYLTDANGVVANPNLDQALPAIVFSIIGTLVLVQMPAVASALGGGVAMSTLGAVSWAYGKAKSGASSLAALRPSNIRRALNKVRSGIRADARAVRAGGKAVGGAAKAVYGKITGSSRNRVSQGKSK
ncbi:TrbL/VirB6 family protein [Verminephrobacter aporrectodeae]|uniref:type IV secretion system protein n=1 Tax=Verminephrobacter aporrectodeae TaxID=1110389 RepID=UPI000593A41E|nr:type IV secretion system protein [Verminephrobacter aporrectodeae]